MKRRTLLAAAATAPAASLISLVPAPALAQQAPWPTKPVRWLVPWGAGGAADVIARTVTQKLSERWGQTVVVENKPGGNTIIAASEVVRAAPDGHTLFMALSTTLTSNVFLHSKLPYDPVRDFTPITQIAGLPLILLGAESAPAKTLPELIEAARRSPDALTLGTAAGSQLQAEQWVRDWGVKIRIIIYKSGADVTKALLSNEIYTGLDAIPANLVHIRAGKMVGMAVNTTRRMPMVPNVPTLEELRIKNTAPGIWHALVAPAGLAPALQARIYADLQAVLAMPDIREKLVDQLGTEIVAGIGPQELAQKMRAETAVVGPLIKELGLKVD